MITFIKGSREEIQAMMIWTGFRLGGIELNYEHGPDGSKIELYSNDAAIIRAFYDKADKLTFADGIPSFKIRIKKVFEFVDILDPLNIVTGGIQFAEPVACKVVGGVMPDEVRNEIGKEIAKMKTKGSFGDYTWEFVKSVGS